MRKHGENARHLKRMALQAIIHSLVEAKEKRLRRERLFGILGATVKRGKFVYSRGKTR